MSMDNHTEIMIYKYLSPFPTDKHLFLKGINQANFLRKYYLKDGDFR